jgi:hypothetical protein
MWLLPSGMSVAVPDLSVTSLATVQPTFGTIHRGMRVTTASARTRKDSGELDGRLQTGIDRDSNDLKSAFTRSHRPVGSVTSDYPEDFDQPVA